MELIRNTLKAMRLGEPKTVDGLTVFPLFGPVVTQREYVTLEEALESGSARVTEVTEGGSVPELKFVNEGDQPVILIDGATLLGAKQDRVINITIVVPGKAVTPIPVSCCEAGRWRRRSVEFKSAGYTMYAGVRAAKSVQVSQSMATSGSRQSDQGAIWDDIAMKMESVGSRSETSAMSDMYSQFGERIESYTGKFPPAEGQTGVLIGMEGRVVGLDLFDSPETLATYLPQLLRSYAVDALGRGDEVEHTTPAQAAGEFLTDVSEAEVKEYPAVGLGEDLRFESPKVTGGALAIEGRVVHLTAFRSSQQAASPQHRGGGLTGGEPVRPGGLGEDAERPVRFDAESLRTRPSHNNRPYPHAADCVLCLYAGACTTCGTTWPTTCPHRQGESDGTK